VKIPKKRCLVIAEAGVNHNGSFLLAKKLIKVAVKAGADFVKFQTFDPDALVTCAVSKAGYQKKNTGNSGNQRQMLAKLYLKRRHFVCLRKECRRHGIGFLSTAFDSGSLDFVESLKPEFHKISSGDIDNIPFLRQVARYGRPVILSTGMATMNEIRSALEVLIQAGLPKRKVILLQCHTEYPSQPFEINLKVMDTFRKKFGVQAGLSDHSFGIPVSLAAAARGAKVVEKHFTLNRSMKGPDHRASLNPLELAEMVGGIRKIEQALGDGLKRPSAREKRIKKHVRKFLVAARPIRSGERLGPANLTLKRAGGGIPASRWDAWLNKKAKRNYRRDEAIRA
jgi:N,N'-diacetyllegionaminate synthase